MSLKFEVMVGVEPYLSHIAVAVFDSLKYCVEEEGLPPEVALDVAKDVVDVLARHCIWTKSTTEVEG